MSLGAFRPPTPTGTAGLSAARAAVGGGDSEEQHGAAREHGSAMGAAEELHAAIKQGDVTRVREVVLAQPEVLNESVFGHADGWTPLYMAVMERQGGVARLLVEMGADLDTVSDFGKTPLVEACMQEMTDTAQVIINKGADVDFLSKDGFTALMLACKFDQASVASLLVQKGASLDTIAAKDGGWTALMYACRYSRPKTTKLLVEHGAQLDTQQREGFTALMLACEVPADGVEDRASCVKALWTAGASLDFKTTAPGGKIPYGSASGPIPAGSSALDIATLSGSANVVDFLNFVQDSAVAKLLQAADVGAPRSVVAAFFDAGLRTKDDCRALGDEALQDLGLTIPRSRATLLAALAASPPAAERRGLVARLRGWVSRPARQVK